MSDAYIVIAKAIEQSRKNTFIMLVVMAVLAIGAPFLALVRLEENQEILYGVTGIAFLFFGGLTLFAALRYRKYMDPGTSPIMEALNTPGRVVWYHEREIEHAYIVDLRMNDGRREQLEVEKPDLPRLLEALGEILPDAVRGYDKELEKKYKADPSAFGKKTS